MAMNATITGLSLAISPSSSSSQASSTSLTLATRPLKTSFFNGGVGAFKAAGIQTATANKTRCSGHGGGALGAQMNLFDRFARVIKSYANAVLSSVEDPEKILEQTVLEMNDDLTKMRQATAQDNASTLKAQFDQQKNVVENLVSNTRLLESKIQEAKSKKDTLKARLQLKSVKCWGNVNTSSSLSAFEKMEEKVMAMESQAEALNQLTTDDLEGKFALLESSSVDDDLANLKKELSGSPMKGELPASRSAAVSSTNAAFPFRDSEIENELNELRRKAKEF
ncbi:putative membrane-associated protein, chloroplastic [Cinnamomum micranthum f. kanehirae]|uniref:Putative membrane-associated protein, chloroplastic n=1 Tax=Cinnamomum micranthum f. kanehirae TaxID=337451 RepID=A0A3S4N2H5_9MAGN|nr:putative membrane-associated protein, chloroplastic [Cinnamomum micranthum f. kanehirae]